MNAEENGPLPAAYSVTQRTTFLWHVENTSQQRRLSLKIPDAQILENQTALTESVQEKDVGITN